jgi:hypothetical protein
MGIVVNRLTAFENCHGYKLSDDELWLWSPGVVGALSDEQERLCGRIVIENAKGGPKVFSSVESALRAEVEYYPRKHLKQQIAIRTCAQMLDRAEDLGIISSREDVYDFMDYCMEKMGFPGEKVRYPKPEIRAFIEEQLSRLQRKLDKLKE